jgi:hypothetical protein
MNRLSIDLKVWSLLPSKMLCIVGMELNCMTTIGRLAGVYAFLLCFSFGVGTSDEHMAIDSMAVGKANNGIGISISGVNLAV